MEYDDDGSGGHVGRVRLGTAPMGSRTQVLARGVGEH